ncbi:MAG TPA: cytochrome c biogenesis protein CcdA [bacterium]|nr:cytochrome c biogenesis protein CcdA [bacterium]HOM26703.1 cytochrome c biogenesis protein CcdA [bacterium]
MENISYIGSFILGIITCLSPCSIAILIAVLSFIISEEESIKNGIYIGIFFTLGMSLVFFILGIFISKIGQLLKFSHYFYLISGILLIFFGLLNLGIFKKKKTSGSLNFFQRFGFSILSLNKYSKLLTSFLFGILFSLGWAPCATSLIMPVAILVMAQEISILKGGFLLFLFGLGHGFPVIPLSALSGTVRTNITKKTARKGDLIIKIFGIIIILFGILFIVYGPKINTLIGGKK